ncbi:MAG TPA: response regulator transcription factor [Syntrophales bacterium]|nr:response regulator transcription factor [Syntrophales bacterium]HOX94553.1 response regulator transcription factor [Syntrophales bacterium]HPI57433.1 response regulator transcription factor [Syntrophales bacterium]HPN25710.1 response regulator transcription factor [Syntrophales bacterium]HQM29458.1 response regulator transcription factor [Syntrophales bacterium]
MRNSGEKRILIVEDDAHIAEGLRLNLSLKGYTVKISPDGVSGIRDWKEWKPELIVLDIMLPGIDGLAVLRNIRLEDERLPILILSARGEIEDRIKGLSWGVDDYLAKPFNLDEFLLRVDRLLKRSSWEREDSSSAGAPAGNIYKFGKNVIDFEKYTAVCGCGKVILTEQEVKLLRLFIANRGKPLSRNELLEIGWGYTGSTPTRTVDNFIVRFRKYFEDNPHEPVFFRSLRSVGYIFDHDQ